MNPPEKRSHTRILLYPSLFVGLVTFAYLVGQATGDRPAFLHTTYETIATVLALMIGMMALTRHYSKKDNKYLVLGATFAATGVFDGAHTILTSPWFLDSLPSQSTALVPWSWFVARLLLSSLFVSLWFAWRHERRFGEAGRLNEGKMYLGVGLWACVTLFVFLLVPLPPAYFGTSWVSRPQELIPAAFFLLALITSFRTEMWQGDRGKPWVQIALGLELMTQLLMAQSAQLHDALFSMAHVAKALGYLCVLAGLSANMYETFLQAGTSAREAKRAAENLEHAHVELEHRVQQRTLDLATANLTLKIEIAEHTKAQESLDQSRRRYQDLLDTIDGIVWEADASTFHFTFVSKQAEKILGYSLAEWLTKPSFWKDHLHPDDREGAIAYCLNKVRQGQDHEFEYRMTAADGRTVWLRDFVAVVREAGRPAVLRGVMVDITERKRLEEHLSHAQKMEAVGQLAGGIAHDFNNLLTAIIGHSELALAAIPPDSVSAQHLSEIRKAGDLARSLTSQLLMFSRRDVVRPEVVSLTEVVGKSASLLGRLNGNQVQLDVRLHAAGFIKVDPGQIEQILINLASNARDAMPQGGRLTITTADVRTTDPPPAEFPDCPPGPYVRLDVCDTGCGMDAATQARIFEPFFTTKPPGKGTGLGLSNVYGVVRQSGGRITVRSAPGEGSSFMILFPLVEPSADSTVAPTMPPAPAGGTETILVVDDNPAVLTLARAVLETKGYCVLEASGGQEALFFARTYPAPIHLLLSDVVMPDLGGPELTQHLVVDRPDMKTLFMSGYTDDVLLHQVGSTGRTAFLPKPFTPQELLTCVRESLDAGPSSSPSPVAEPTNGTLRILLADDDEQVLQVVMKLLKSAGHAVHVARNGREAIELVAGQTFDLVLTDILMPDKDGIETIRQLRRQAPAVRIIAMSGGGQLQAEVYLNLAQKLGIARTLRKPFSRDELLHAVQVVSSPR